MENYQVQQQNIPTGYQQPPRVASRKKYSNKSNKTIIFVIVGFVILFIMLGLIYYFVIRETDNIKDCEKDSDCSDNSNNKFCVNKKCSKTEAPKSNNSDDDDKDDDDKDDDDKDDDDKDDDVDDSIWRTLSTPGYVDSTNHKNLAVLPFAFLNETPDQTLKQCTDICGDNNECQSYSFIPSGSGGKGTCQFYQSDFINFLSEGYSTPGKVNTTHGIVKTDRNDVITREKHPIMTKVRGWMRPETDNYADMSGISLGACIDKCKTSSSCKQIYFIPPDKTTTKDAASKRCRILNEVYPITNNSFETYVYEK